MSEQTLLTDADRRALAYLQTVSTRRVFPSPDALNNLAAFAEAWPENGRPGEETIELLDVYGSPATVVSNGPNYYGFVIGATLPAAAAAERIAIAWDQCASSYTNSPVADRIERVATQWILEALDLPRESAVSFGTSATACGLACLAAARRTLLSRRGWDIDARGLAGAPKVRVVVSALTHITVRKALRVLGFGLDNLEITPVDQFGRMDPEQLPPLDDMTILCLQAGEVNTGEFDPFEPLIARARKAGAWVHVDGAFGLWARTSPTIGAQATGVEGADSWTVDGHKWLNTPYDGAMGIVRDADALAGAMNSDAEYSSASADSQKNLGLEFSRRARGIPIWAALRTLGRNGVTALIERHCRLAQRLASGLAKSDFEILNRVCLNQVLVRLDTDEATIAFREAALQDGALWFGTTVWEGRAACRLSVTSWRTDEAAIDRAIDTLARARITTSRLSQISSSENSEA